MVGQVTDRCTLKNTYTISIGGGGKGSLDTSVNGVPGANGGDTIFSGTEIKTIIAKGGGGGGAYDIPAPPGKSGGCGGGANLYNGLTGGKGFQGGNGGTTEGEVEGPHGGAGGGGIGGNGSNQNGSGRSSPNGGVGVTYLGQPYGGGGGGGIAIDGLGPAGRGGSGVGGNGGDTIYINGKNGVPNTGSGGGGGGGYTGLAGDGSAGIMILAINTSDKTIITPMASIGLNTSNNNLEISAINVLSLKASNGLNVSGIQPTIDTGCRLEYDTSTNNIVYVTETADQRLKENIKNTSLGIQFINQLRPIEFTWKDSVNIGLDNKGNPLYSSRPGQRKHQGFIAQEVITTLSSFTNNSAMYTCINNNPPRTEQTYIDKNNSTIIATCPSPHEKLRGLYTLRYTEFIPPAVKAIQDVYAVTKTQQSTITVLEAQVSTLTGQLNQVCSKLNIKNQDDYAGPRF